MHPWHDIELGDHIERDYAYYRDVSELPPHRAVELQRFFLDYKVLEGKTVTMGELRGRADAEDVVRAGVRLYRERIAPTRGEEL